MPTKRKPAKVNVENIMTNDVPVSIPDSVPHTTRASRAKPKGSPKPARKPVVKKVDSSALPPKQPTIESSIVPDFKPPI